MPPSDVERDTPPGQALAVLAESLYLANLLLLPGICFVALIALFLRHHRAAPALAVCHLRQTLAASLWAGVALILVAAIMIWLGGIHAPMTWVVALTYLVTIHAAFVLLGTIGLARAMAGQVWRYPLVGWRCDDVLSGGAP
jgi:uncharacterized Tic20 family protein